ncbi:MAG: GNAT family N-acetyltransferase [Dokdonella sp.]
MDFDIRRNDAAHRFETTLEDTLCVLDYRLHDGVLSIDHVGVPQPVAGRGIAAALTKTALDTARAENWRVVAHCPYAAAWIERHPQYRDLLNHV